MKICHAITRFIVGGAQENTLATVTGLAVRGHDVTLISGPSPGPEGRLFEAVGLSVSALPFRFIEEPHLVRPLSVVDDVRAWQRLRRHFANERYDVVHTHSSKAGVVGRRAARRARIAGGTTVVHTIHGLACDALQPWWRNLLYRTAERMCARDSDALVTVCDAMKTQALAQGIGRPVQFTTIYSGMDVAAYGTAAGQREEMRARHGIAPDEVVLLSVARLFPLKGVDQFLQAVAEAQRHSGRPVRGVVVGDGPLRPALEQWARIHTRAGSVRFTGLVPPTDIPAWVAAADAVVHASAREGLARALVQGLAGGRPVVAYDVGGAAEVVRDGRNGLLCRSGGSGRLCAQVVQVCRDDALRAALTAGARATRLEEFSVAAMVGTLEALYARLRPGKPSA